MCGSFFFVSQGIDYEFETQAGPKGSVVGILRCARCREAGIVPVSTVVPVNIVLRIDVRGFAERSCGNDQAPAFEAGIGDWRAAMGAKAFGDNTGFIGNVALDQLFP